jgi:hypothetical protein
MSTKNFQSPKRGGEAHVIIFEKTSLGKDGAKGRMCLGEKILP